MEDIREVAIHMYEQSETTIERNHASCTAGKTQMKGDVDFMKKRLAEVPGEPLNNHTAQMTIFRLPYHEINKQLCEPKVVSIGPFHRGKANLRTMEEHKWSTLRDFLARNESVGLEFYHQAMKSIEEQTRQCYSEPVELGSDEFAMMMLLDGCFMLEWMYKGATWEKDYICYTAWNVMDVFDDLCLMENQVPFFVIHNLWAIREQGVGWSPNCKHPCTLLDLVMKVFEMCSHESIKFKRPQKSCTNIKHLLDLYFAGVTSEFGDQPPTQSKQRNLCVKLFSRSSKAASGSSQHASSRIGRNKIHIMCVSELCDAGVKFKKKKNPTHMLDISFVNGTIEMPFLKIDSHFVMTLWNMVALEQVCLYWGIPQTLSSYLALMDSLIDTEKDVALLERAGIVDSYFSNANEAAVFFNQFGKLFVLSYNKHYFYDLFKGVKKYSESTWHKNRARLMQDYFSNPWAIISVMAAMVLFALTIVQTYYSAK